MKLCSDEHDEVCFKSRLCPACVAIKERNEIIFGLKRDIIRLEEDIKRHLGNIRFIHVVLG